MGDYDRDYAFASDVPDPPSRQLIDEVSARTFMGYRRANGKVGTRNYIAIISTVNCSASVSKAIARHFNADALRDYPNIDGVVALTHGTGCGMADYGESHEQLQRVYAGMANHPNVGAVVTIGLGCEVTNVASVTQRAGLVQIESGDGATSTSSNGDGPITLVMQESGGTANTIDMGIKGVAELLPRINDIQREPLPASHVILGTECGGSDGNSGVTANPALGVCSDRLVAAGGTSILSETTEIYGAEHLLTRRAVSRDVGQKLVDLIDWWKRYTSFFGVKIDNNPSPGNKNGGLTTIYEKSLGAVAKGGSTALKQVYKYAEPVTEKGFVVMDSPGFDPPSVTGMVAGGANVVCFTTGRGSCFGCKPVPSIKIATNTPMYERMVADMDFNAGVVLEGVPVEEVGKQLFDLVLDVASGRKTKSELQGIGDEEFVPWVIGPVL